VQKALEFQPTNADIYGQLGVIYFRSRNYEGSIFSFQCAIRGCSGVDSCLGRGLDKCYPDLGEDPHEISGLPIAPNTIVYYYTYGSVLAALSRPKDNKCEPAMQIFSEVRAELNANPKEYADGRDTIINIIEAGETICASLAEDGLPSLSVEDATPTPEAGTADLTVTPTP